MWNVTDNNMWFRPECTRNGSDGNVGPSPRAFHIAVAIDCHMFIFGGRSGSNRYHCIFMFIYISCNFIAKAFLNPFIHKKACRRLGDFWVLDTGKLLSSILESE